MAHSRLFQPSRRMSAYDPVTAKGTENGGTSGSNKAPVRDALHLSWAIKTAVARVVLGFGCQIFDHANDYGGNRTTQASGS